MNETFNRQNFIKEIADNSALTFAYAHLEILEAAVGAGKKCIVKNLSQQMLARTNEY